MQKESMAVVLVSAASEWQAVRDVFPDAQVGRSPFGEWFDRHSAGQPPLVFMQGGWGKISAAASTQYAIDRWRPRLLINVGTCGGFEGQVARGTIVLAERTLVYDILEQMVDVEIGIARYTTALDLSWLSADHPQGVLRTLLVSADRDLVAQELPELNRRYGAVVGDWESGAIAYVSACNQIPCLILRGVTDLVGSGGGEAYGQIEVFHAAARVIMRKLIADLPAWLAASSKLFVDP